MLSDFILKLFLLSHSAKNEFKQSIAGFQPLGAKKGDLYPSPLL